MLSGFEFLTNFPFQAIFRVLAFAGFPVSPCPHARFSMSAIITQIHNVDLILTEGYKHELFPKIAIYRAASGNGLSIPLKDCLAIVGDYPSPAPCPVFSSQDPRPLADYLLQLLQTGALTT